LERRRVCCTNNPTFYLKREGRVFL
jgi:hypothetical protein